MKKVLLYIDSRNRGGAQRVLVELANAICKKGKYEIVFVCDIESQSNAYELDKSIKEVILEREIHGNPITRQYYRLKQLKKVCNLEKPDLILSFLILQNIKSLIVGRMLDIPVVISIRNDPTMGISWLLRILMRIFFPWASGWVFQTRDAKEYFEKWVNGPSEIILNPISREVIEYVNGNEKKNQIVSVGRLEKQKNFELLIKAFAKAFVEEKNIRLVIYGEGSQRPILERIIDQLGLADRVELPGIKKDILSKIDGSIMFVMSSDYEGIPNALMEAMGIGLPVISTDCPCGGPRMLIENGVNGVLVPVCDEDSLIKEMKRLIQNEKLRSDMGQKGRSIKQICEIEKISNQWEEFINQVIKK